MIWAAMFRSFVAQLPSWCRDFFVERQYCNYDFYWHARASISDRLQISRASYFRSALCSTLLVLCMFILRERNHRRSRWTCRNDTEMVLTEKEKGCFWMSQEHTQISWRVCCVTWCSFSRSLWTPGRLQLSRLKVACPCCPKTLLGNGKCKWSLRSLHAHTCIKSRAKMRI